MRILLFLVLAALIPACKKTSTQEQKTVDAKVKSYESNPSDSTAEAAIHAMNQYIEAQGYQDEATPKYLLRAARISSDHNKGQQALEYHQTYLVQYPESPDRADRLAEVITLTEQLKQPELNQILYKSFVAKYPKDSRAASFDAKIENKAISVDSVISTVFHNMFDESIFRLNEEKSRLYIQACETAIMADPTLPGAPEHLLRAAETGRTLRDIPKALKLYTWIIDQYPTHHRASTALFLKGFIYDNDLKDFKTAGAYYQAFLEKYPENEYTESARFLLDNLGKTEDELRQMLEAKSKQNVQ